MIGYLGIREFESAIAGLGGCPFAPAATGNIPTDDLLYLLDRSGVVTGVSLEKIIATSQWLIGQLGRGTPEKPGLMLVVEDAPQETCWGVAHRIAPEHLESETGILWSREMLTGAYEPRWVDLERDEGPLRAFTFTVNRAHPRYTGALPPEEIARRIAQAEGILGTNRDYLYRTHACLAAHGLDDAHISDIFARVCRLTGDRPDHLPAGA